MQSLHIDILQIIASVDEAVWTNLALVDPVFGAYARSHPGRLAFVRAFTVVFSSDTETRYRLYGHIHRIDGPAEIFYKNGILTSGSWYIRGLQHRGDDLPAVEYADGGREWYYYGIQHRGGDNPAGVTTSARVWMRHGKRHRDGDLPAYISEHGSRWYQHGVLHRDNGPADINQFSETWYRMGCVHRDDGPAVTGKDGTRMWYKHDHLHNGGDNPAIIYANDTLAWYECGQRHRVNGPAITRSDGSYDWYQYGHQHRVDGPAIVRANGSQSWFQYGERYREGGLPVVIKANGRRVWTVSNNMYHYTDGPAIEDPDGTQRWMLHGEDVGPLIN